MPEDRHESQRAPTPADEVVSAMLQPSADMLVVEALIQHRCRESDLEHVQLTRHVTRSANQLVIGEE